MSIKSLLLFLFLYVCLVWVGAGLLKDGPEIRTFGLFWTAVGLIALIAWIIFSWAWGWFRVAKARSNAKPKVSPKAAPPVVMNEDDAALLALIQEAKNSLTKSATSARQTRFSDLPVYLLVGPEGVGKTSSFVNSGVDPVCLSGQPAGAGQTIPTRVANIWLAKNALFIELGGRAFSGDLGRWASLLRTLHGGSSPAGWRRFFKEPESGLNLRGVLALGDVKEFMGASSPQGRDKLERLSSQWRERLGAITEVFGRQLPVYWITTKTDIVPYFADYFGTLRGTELSQIFGCSLPFIAPINGAPAELPSAQVENKRLTKSTSPLLHRLAERRVVHLARENDPRRKPGIYEFPREMRRIRPTVVQFMVDVFRPHPLRHTPFLRGYYFTGLCEEEAGPVSLPARSSLPDDSIVSDATAVFKADATQVFRSAENQVTLKTSARTSGTRRWAFVTDLLTGVILSDNVLPRTIPAQVDERFDFYRKAACGAACFLSLLLCLCFLRSWSGNSRLLESVNGGNIPSTRHPNAEDLKALDKLHDQALLLSNYDRNGAPWRLRWGLYTGGLLVHPARDLYFQRFGEMLLFGLNDSITARLKSSPATAGTDDANYRPISELLKAHLMISSGACSPDSAFVSRVLKRALDETNPSEGPEWRQLAYRQIDFYAAELPNGNPLKIVPDDAAVEHARSYLRSIQGADRIYASLLSGAEKRFGTPQTLSALAPQYGKVLNGPAEVNGVFTPDGWAYMKAASKDVKANMPGDPCLDESRGMLANYQQDNALEGAIQRSFIRDYIAAWQKFVDGFSVVRYSGPADAARKLELLSDPKSPLLAVFALASKNTYFVPAQPSTVEKSLAPITNVIDKARDTLIGPRRDGPLADGKQFELTTEIVRVFQPVQQIVQPASDTWVYEKNKAYVDALADLGRSMDQIAHATTPDPAISQTATQNYDKALSAARQLREALAVTSGGPYASVQRLLEEPIIQAKYLIPTPVDITQKVNGAARRFCGSIDSTLRKYPFQPSTQEASLEEVAHLFAPGAGTVWKFEADNLADSVVKDGASWKAKDGAKVPPTAETLVFLNRAQTLTDAFFPAGASQPQLRYTLRPKLDPAFQNVFVELDVDGQPFQWKNSIQHQFNWPASGGSVAGAVGRVVTGDGVSFAFASYGGTWGVFHLMSEAQPRILGTKVVEWKYSRGGGREDRPELIKPAPVRLEFVDLPGGADVFNPKFFADFQCSGKAVQQLQY